MTAPAGIRPDGGSQVRKAAASSPEVLIEARGIGVHLGGAQILRDVELSVRAGEIVALVGPNGAGKSTLLSVLAGDVTPETGVVLLEEVDLRTVDVVAISRRRAVQMQEARVSFAFTVTEVVRMGRAPWHGTDHAEADDAVVADAMSRTEITHLATRRFPSLSGGEKARTAFARALTQETALLLLDEPTAALDIRHQESLLRLVRQRAAAGVGIVVVLHDLSLAAAYADRIVLLDGGRVRADGPPRTVLTPSTLEDVYGHPVSVLDHAESGGLVVVPIRAPRAPSHDQESP